MHWCSALYYRTLHSVQNSNRYLFAKEIIFGKVSENHAPHIRVICTLCVKNVVVQCRFNEDIKTIVITKLSAHIQVGKVVPSIKVTESVIFLLFSANFALLQKCAILLHLQRRQQLLWIFSTSLHVGTQLQFHVVCQKKCRLDSEM